jgi:type IV secretory pathway VirD2 relaxase
VSLHWAKGEVVPAQDLVAIADQYMQGMGYGRQPYAVYQHHDTEHPHVHIVSVRVDEIGKKIPDSF